MVMNKKRVLAIILVMAIVFGGCSKDKTIPAEKMEEVSSHSVKSESKKSNYKNKISIETIKVPYDKNDTLNPYTLKSQLNSLITPLIFDGLVKVDANYKPVECIAKEITKQANTVTVKINDVYFSDNTMITADDVVRSFDMAKKSASKYSYNLRKINSAKKISADTITFEMNTESRNYKNLFNFPIIKSVGDNVIGSGRYVLTNDGGKKVLVKTSSNSKYEKLKYPVERIELINFDGKSSPSFKINMNEIDVSYNKIELKNDKAVTLPYVLVPTNDLIYIGVNSKSGYMSNNEFKKAVVNSLDISKIGVYVSLREDDLGSGYLNPQFYKSKPQKQNLIDAKKSLENLGYKAEKAGEIRIGSDKKPVNLKLVVNEENLERKMMAEEIKRQLFDAGINVEIISVQFDTYKSKLKSNDFDLYIGEIGLSDDLDLTPILKPSDVSGFGANESSTSVLEYEKYKKGEITEKELCDMLISDVPFIPIAYSDALLYHKRNFVSYIVATNDDIFYNILNWDIE